MKYLSVLFIFVLSATMSNAEETLFERAKNLYDVQSYMEALALYDRIITENDKNLPEALDLSGWCLRYLNKWQEAEKRFYEALKVLSGDNTSWVHVGLGEIFIETGEYAKAIKNFDEAIKLDSNNEELVLRCEKGKKVALENLNDIKPKKAATLAKRRKTRKQEPQKSEEYKMKPAIVFGITLGVPMNEIDFSQKEINRKYGETYYSVSLSKNNIPQFISDGAKNIHFQFVERRKRLHKIVYIVSYKDVPDVESRKEKLETELVEYYEGNFGVLTDFRKGIFHDELRWINSERHVISANVGNDLGGQIILEVSFIDLASL